MLFQGVTWLPSKATGAGGGEGWAGGGGGQLFPREDTFPLERNGSYIPTVLAENGELALLPPPSEGSEALNVDLLLLDSRK